MSTLSQSAAWFRDEVGLIGKATKSALEAIAASRQAKADDFVRPYLAKLSAYDLAEMGYSKSQIERIKADRGRALPYFV